MSTHNICFCGEVKKKKFQDTPSYLELCECMGVVKEEYS